MNTESFDKAGDLLSALRLADNRWTPPGKYESPWIFRGQASASWDLVPRAYRTDDTSLHVLKEELGADAQRYVNGNFDASRFTEEQRRRKIEVIVTYAAVAEAVSRFVRFLDELGFSIPRELHHLDVKQPSLFPNERKLLSIEYPLSYSVGLASHHNIATHVLDFTRNPLVAAFFAAIDCIENDHDGSDLAVWALNTECRGQQLGVFTCPRNENNYLHAQAGVFLYLEKGYETYEREGRWPAFHESMGLLVHQASALKKLTLPRSEAPELVRLLWVERVTRAHLMPTYDNVARTLCSTWRLNPG